LEQKHFLYFSSEDNLDENYLLIQITTFLLLYCSSLLHLPLLHLWSFPH